MLENGIELDAKLDANARLRRIQELKESIHQTESKISDAEMNIEYLTRLGKGKEWGFFFSLIPFIGALACAISYQNMQEEAMIKGIGDGINNAFTFSVSTTTLTFIYPLIIIFALFSCVIGLRVMMQKGTGSLSQSLAAHFGIINYPSRIESKQFELAITKSELENLQMEYETLINIDCEDSKKQI